jgi:dTDP-glucose pyrophosphorylase
MSKIRNIVLVCNSESLEKYQLLLGDGSELGVSIEYAIQDNPEGIPHAINTATQEKKYIPESYISVLKEVKVVNQS